MFRQKKAKKKSHKSFRPTLETLERRELFAIVLPITADLGSSPASVTQTAILGDSAAGSKEVDLYKVDLRAGASVTATTSQPARAAAVDTYLRLFDASGRPISGAANDDIASPTNLYSRVQYTVPTDGTYYIGVTGYGNSTYDLTTGAGLNVGKTGRYALNVISTAPQPLPINADLGRVIGTLNQSGVIGDSSAGNKEVELYRVELVGGASLTATTSRPVGAAPVDTYLRLFDTSGRQVAYDDDSAGSFYSRLSFTTPAGGGVYLLGVSEYGNHAYNPLTGTGTAGGKTGPYGLAVQTTGNVPPPITLEGRDIVIQGTSDADTARIRLVSGQIVAEVTIGGVLTSQSFAVGSVDRVRATLLGGNDFLENQTALHLIADGGEGNDQFVVQDSSGGTGTLTGGAGIDTVVVGGRSMTLTDSRLTAGAMSLQLSGIENANLTGGDGNDTLDARMFSGTATLSGAAGNDTLWGSLGSHTLMGGEGDDTLYGSAGRNTLIGGAGLDTVNFASADAGMAIDLATGRATGGTINDQLSTIENVVGSRFADTISGDSGANRIYAGDDNDVLDGRGGNDELYGEGGDDTLTDWLGSNRLDGGTGRTTFRSEAGGGLSLTGSTQTRVVGDVTVYFDDGSSRWTSDEIDAAVLGLSWYLRVTGGNTKLLQYTDGRPLRFVNVAADDTTTIPAGFSGLNEPDSEYRWWDDSVFPPVERYENRHGTIRIRDQSRSALTAVVVHEVAHNWDDPSEAGAAVDAFRKISGWIPGMEPIGSVTNVYYVLTKSSLGNDWWQYLRSADERFVDNYAKSNPYEDWAETVEKYFLDYDGGVSATPPYQEKLDVVAAWLDSFRGASPTLDGQYDGARFSEPLTSISRLRRFGEWSDRVGGGFAIPNFEQADYGNGTVFGTTRLLPNATVFQDIPAAELGNPSGAEARFLAMHRWADGHGYVSAVPTFQQASYGGAIVYGAHLLKPGTAIVRDIFASELGNPASMEERFRAIGRWASSHGYAAGYPNFEQANYGQGTVYGAVLILPGYADHRDVPEFMVTGNVSLRTANGRFVVAENGGGREMAANRTAAGPWETFTVVPLGGDQVALQASNGQYVVAENGGGGAVNANRNAIGSWETFTVVRLGGHGIAFRTASGYYLCAEGGGGNALVANRRSVGGWETFQFSAV